MVLDDKTLKEILELVADKKGIDPVLFSLRGVSVVTDFCLIVTGKTSIQVKAITEYLEEYLPELGIRVFHTEGLPAAKWVLLDCGGDLVIHVMTPDDREFYQLERLWKDAEKLELELDVV